MVRERILGLCRDCDAIGEEQDTSDDTGLEQAFHERHSVRVLPSGRARNPSDNTPNTRLVRWINRAVPRVAG